MEVEELELGARGAFKCVGIGNESGVKGFASSVAVGVIAFPGIKGWILEGASKTEGDWPGEGAIFGDFGEIVGGLFNSLASR